MKRLLVFLLAAILIIPLVFIAHNNFGAREVSAKDIDASYVKGVRWLVENKQSIMQQHNPPLWWMLARAIDLTGDPQLTAIVAEYRRKNYQRYARSPWRYLIYDAHSTIDGFQILTSDLVDYNKHFIYGYSCNADMQNSDVIMRQNKADFCMKNYPISPACMTHQMMALRFMQRENCGDPAMVSETVEVLSDYIRYQLIVDFRVVDVYLQRVLMLVDSGNLEKINHRWIYRVANAQLADGGWSGFQPLIPLGSDKAIGFSQRIASIGTAKSSFHATAQGVLLMAMLKNTPAFEYTTH